MWGNTPVKLAITTIVFQSCGTGTERKDYSQSTCGTGNQGEKVSRSLFETGNKGHAFPPAQTHSCLSSWSIIIGTPTMFFSSVFLICWFSLPTTVNTDLLICDITRWSMFVSLAVLGVYLRKLNIHRPLAGDVRGIWFASAGSLTEFPLPIYLHLVW